jgi:glycosyltransferase involved in cell wall biosynthesis
MKHLISRVIRELKKNSIPDLIRKVSFYYLGKGKYLWALNPEDWKKKKEKNAFSRYQPGDRKSKDRRIVYILPGTWIAGGIAVVLKHANLLKERGHDVTILSQDLKTTVPWFKNQRVEILPMSRIDHVLERGIDILIATGWNSAPTADLIPARRKLYFVQSDERRFYSDEAAKSMVAETYRLPFEYITMAKWIQTWLREEFGHEAAYVPNGLDTTLFRPSEPMEPKGKKSRILVEGPIDLPFKGMADAYAAIKHIDAEKWIVSSQGKPPEQWQYDRFFESVSLHDMPRLYSSCDILLKMSTVESFAYPPLEMMACGGVSVIRRVSGIEEYAVDEENCLIVESIGEAEAAVKRLIADEDLWRRLATAGLATATRWTWDRSVVALEEALREKE